MKLQREIIAIWSLLCVAGILPVAAGTITGRVSGKGAEVPPGAGGDGAYSSRRYKFVERVDYEQLTDFVIYVDQAVGGSGPPEEPAAMVQRDAAFYPHVLPVMVGTVVRWPNQDTIYHNVFSMSETKEFNLGLYKDKTENAPTVLFDRVGRVDVFCGIHSKMHCVILVLPSRHFSTADARGNYRIEGVPAGTYKLKAWHERLPSQTREVTVSEDGEVVENFELSLAGPPNN